MSADTPHGIRYTAPEWWFLAARLRAQAARLSQLADEIASRPAVDTDATERTATHRMAMDTDAQIQRCESAAGIVRRAGGGR